MNEALFEEEVLGAMMKNMMSFFCEELSTDCCFYSIFCLSVLYEETRLFAPFFLPPFFVLDTKFNEEI